MPNIQKVDIESKIIKGLQVRTKNSDEMNTNTQKIAPLWERFFQEVLPNLAEASTVYGVYLNYESDVMGEYDLLVGTKELEDGGELLSVTIEAGRYLVFSAKGELPQAIIEAWQQVWACKTTWS